MSSEARKILEEVIKEAEEKGAANERVEIAKDMLKSKEFSYAQVAKISRLSMAEVKQLAVSYS